MPPKRNTGLLLGSEQNQSLPGRLLSPAEEAVLKVFINPDNFGLCREDKRKKTSLRKPNGGAAPVSQKKFKAITSDQWFIQQYRDAIVARIGEDLGPILNAAVNVAKIEGSSAGHQDRKMLLSIMGIYTEKKDYRHSGEVGAKLDVGDRLRNSINRVRDQAQEEPKVINGDATELPEPQEVERSHHEYRPENLDSEEETVI